MIVVCENCDDWHSQASNNIVFLTKLPEVLSGTLGETFRGCGEISNILLVEYNCRCRFKQVFTEYKIEKVFTNYDWNEFYLQGEEKEH